MKKLILIGICMILLISIVSTLEICEYEEDPYPSCRIITPAGMTCSTYNLYHPDNSTNITDGTMGIVNADAGLYSVVFNGSDAGGWSVQLCDNSTAYINIKTTDETDLTTILANQVTIDANIMAVSSDMGLNFTNQSDDRRTQFNTANETSSLVLEILTDATNGLTAIKNYLVNIIKAGIDGLTIGMDNNRTQLQSDVKVDTDLIINVSRDTENETRTQIIDMAIAGTLANSTEIGQAVLRETVLANRTVTYWYSWDLLNVTTVYDDLGYEISETYIYNDTANNWYLNSTQFRRIA